MRHHGALGPAPEHGNTRGDEQILQDAQVRLHRVAARHALARDLRHVQKLRVRERRHFQKPAEVIQAPHQPLRLHLLLQVQVDVAAQGSVRRLRRGDDTAAAVSRRRAAR